EPHLPAGNGGRYLPNLRILWYTTEDLEYLFKGDADSILLKRFEGCTAIVCYNDQMALNVIRFLERNNIKPFDDVSIIGFDNSTLSKFLDLTSIDHMKYDLGALAAEALIKQIKTGEKTGAKIKTEIIERASVKDIRKN
ncbi:MAG: substrate-binding domain-containing protein, partial [Clostridiales bacterium]|nr:substrate-binding domain-containing protein [Clostridiales bacterium]